MIRTQIQLTEKQAEAIKKIAKSRHLPVAELIRQSVDMIIKTNTVFDYEERRRRAIAIAGAFSSGRHDVSSEHDKYVAEAFGK